MTETHTILIELQGEAAGIVDDRYGTDLFRKGRNGIHDQLPAFGA